MTHSGAWCKTFRLTTFPVPCWGWAGVRNAKGVPSKAVSRGRLEVATGHPAASASRHMPPFGDPIAFGFESHQVHRNRKNRLSHATSGFLLCYGLIQGRNWRVCQIIEFRPTLLSETGSSLVEVTGFGGLCQFAGKGRFLRAGPLWEELGGRC